jgi:hypothetical protein
VLSGLRAGFNVLAFSQQAQQGLFLNPPLPLTNVNCTSRCKLQPMIFLYEVPASRMKSLAPGTKAKMTTPKWDNMCFDPMASKGIQ